MALLFAAVAALGGFLFGYDLGLIGGALMGIRRELHLTTFQQEAVVGSAKLGAVFGTFLGGCLMLRYGRRKAIAYNSLFFTLGPLVMAVSTNVGGLVIGRLVCGLGIGSSAVSIPAYLAEVAPAASRGAVVQVYEVMLCLGMLSAALVDWMLANVAHGWRWMVGMPSIAGALMALSPAVLPESPRWLVMRNEFDHALTVLYSIIHSHSRDQAAATKHKEAAEDELLLLWSSVEKDRAAVLERRAQLMRARSADYSMLQMVEQPPSPRASPRRAAAAGGSPRRGGAEGGSPRKTPRGKPASSEAPEVPLMAAAAGDSEMVELQDPTDFLATSTSRSAPYSETRPGEERTVLHTMGAMLWDVTLVARGPEAKALWLALGLAFIDQACASTAIINFAPEALRRLHGVAEGNAVLYSSLISASKTIGVVLAFFAVDHLGRRPLLIAGSIGSGVSLLLATPAAAAGSPGLLILAMCLFIFCFSMSWAGLYWVVVSEIFSMGAKSPATSAATALLFLTGAATNFIFLSLMDAMGAFTFVFFGVVALGGAGYVWWQLPETKGKTLLEIQMALQQ